MVVAATVGIVILSLIAVAYRKRQQGRKEELDERGDPRQPASARRATPVPYNNPNASSAHTTMNAAFNPNLTLGLPGESVYAEAEEVTPNQYATPKYPNSTQPPKSRYDTPNSLSILDQNTKLVTPSTDVDPKFCDANYAMIDPTMGTRLHVAPTPPRLHASVALDTEGGYAMAKSPDDHTEFGFGDHDANQPAENLYTSPIAPDHVSAVYAVPNGLMETPDDGTYEAPVPLRRQHVETSPDAPPTATRTGRRAEVTNGTAVGDTQVSKRGKGALITANSLGPGNRVLENAAHTEKTRTWESTDFQPDSLTV
jgi:hypothetical protein